METTTAQRICICDVAHAIPLTDSEIFEALDELMFDPKNEADFGRLAEIQAQGDFYNFHVEQDVLDRYIDSLAGDVCHWENHRRSDCTTDCGL